MNSALEGRKAKEAYWLSWWDWRWWDQWGLFDGPKGCVLQGWMGYSMVVANMMLLCSLCHWTLTPFLQPIALQCWDRDADVAWLPLHVMAWSFRFLIENQALQINHKNSRPSTYSLLMILDSKLKERERQQLRFDSAMCCNLLYMSVNRNIVKYWRRFSH